MKKQVMFLQEFMLNPSGTISDREATVTSAINLATKQLMHSNPKLRVIGLGVNDPKKIFGTTDGLLEEFGETRVLDFPTSENGMLGYAIGLAINGIPSITVHQRFEFFLLAMDQLVNNAAKWFFMFGSKTSVPIVIRVVIGKGWGQGPTHSQSFHSWLSHIPGLKVAIPHDAQSAYDLLIEAVQDPNPVIFVEHRWIHNQIGRISIKPPSQGNSTRLGMRCRKEQIGNPAVTVVSLSFLASRIKSLYGSFKRLDIGFDHIILETIKPYDLQTIVESVRVTGLLLVTDFAPRTNSFAKEVVSEVVMSSDLLMKKPPKILTNPDVIEPTSFHTTKGLYFDDKELFCAVLTLLEIDYRLPSVQAEIHLIQRRLSETPHDVPDNYFKGPF